MRSPRIEPSPLKVGAAVVIEIAYAVFTRTWLRERFQGVELELLVSAVRLATAAAYWLMFRDLIRGRGPRPGSLRHPLVLAGAAAALAIPFLFRGWSPGTGSGTALVFALTSVIVGVREELLYRAVLFNLLEPRVGLAGTLGLSTVLFVVYHYGALPVAPLVIAEVAIMSLVLGLIYARSGSLLAVSALHAVYDGAWFFGPYLHPPLPDAWRLAFLLSALALVFLWQRRIGRSEPARYDPVRT
jgi:membrane protease YdiL (CAAX protease family)